MKHQIKIISVLIFLCLSLAACVDTKDLKGELEENFDFYRVGNSKKIAIETGSLEVGGKIFTIKSSCPGEISFKGIEELGMPGGIVVKFNDPEIYALLSVYDLFEPDGEFAFLNFNGETYKAEDLDVKIKDSYFLKDEAVFEVSGEMHGIKNKETIYAEFLITSSQLGAGDSEIKVKNNKAYLSGTLGTITYNQVIDLMKNHPEVKTIVETTVEGSINDEVNMKTGHMLRDNNFNTEVMEKGYIASGGVDLFISGVNRTIGKGAKVGVHSWGGEEETGADFPRNHEAHNQQKEYHRKMLGDEFGIEFYFYTLEAAPAEEIHFMTVEEIKKWGLETR